MERKGKEEEKIFCVDYYKFIIEFRIRIRSLGSVKDNLG